MRRKSGGTLSATGGPLTGVPQTLQNAVPSVSRAPHFEQNTCASFRRKQPPENLELPQHQTARQDIVQRLLSRRKARHQKTDTENHA